MIAYCNCKNLKITWDLRDLSITPRACQCDYCLSHDIQWLSKPGSTSYETNKTGTRSAVFHKCSYCQTVIASTATINNRHYGAVNRNCLIEKHRFPKPKPVTIDNDQTARDRKTIWQQNWCSQVTIKRPPTPLKLIK